jgi:hypothetical protein
MEEQNRPAFVTYSYFSQNNTLLSLMSEGIHSRESYDEFRRFITAQRTLGLRKHVYLNLEKGFVEKGKKL